MLSAVLKNITVTSGTAYIYTPRNTDLGAAKGFSSGSEQLMEAVTLPMTGTYTILIVPGGEYTGKVEVTSYYADTVTGTIAPTAEGSSKATSLLIPGQEAKYTVSGMAGEEVSLKVSEFTGFSKTLYLEWFNPEGKNITEKAFTSNGFMEPVVFPTTGTYTLVVNPNGFNTGSLKLTAYNASAVTGSITPTSGGESKTVTTTVPGQGAKITFSGTAGEGVSLVLSESTIKSGSVNVLTSEGSGVSESNVSFGTSTTMDGTHQSFVLPKTGTYTIHMTALGEETGSVKLTAYKAPEVTGSITPTTSGASESVSLLIPGQKAKYAVSCSAGEELSVKVSEFTGFSKTVWVEWFNPGGTDIKEKAFTGNGFLESVTCATTGTYHLVVYPYGLNTGSLKVTVYNASAVTGSITPTSGGESKTVTTTVPGQGAKITFSGTAGEGVSLVLSESTIKSGSVNVLTSEGSGVSESNVSFGTSTTMDGTHQSFVLPKTGTYTIHMTALGEETGSVKLTAYKAPEVTGSITPTTSGASESVSLLIPGQKAKYAVSCSAGEELSVKVSEFTGFSKTVWVEWFNPGGTDIKEKEFTSNGFIESVTCATTGTYHLVVYPYGLNTGSLKVTVYNAVTGSITPSSGGESKTITTHGPGQNAKITFSGKSGEEVSIVLSESTIKSGHVVIDNPSGSKIGEEKTFGSSGETALGPVSLSTTGTYTIFIKPEAEYTGSVKLTAYTGSPPHGMIVRRGLGGTTSTVAVGRAGPDEGTQSFAAAAAAPAPGNQTFAVLFGTGGRQALDNSVRQVRRKDAADSTPRADTIAAPGNHRHKAKGGKEANNAISRRLVVSSGTTKKPRSAAHVGVAAGGIATITLPRAVKSFHPTSSGAWFPRRSRQDVVWSTGQPMSPWANLAPPAPAESTITALAGQALKLNGLPLAGLHVAVEDTPAATVTDAAGQFLLTGLPAGHQVLIVEGSAIGAQRYGTFTIGVQIAAHKETTLDAPIWMTPLDPAGNHRIASPTRGRVTITTPRIPGLEVRLPGGTVIHDATGHIVRNLNITAVPVDRPPFPLPFFVEVPVYFTVQPGRAYLSKGAQIIYPNYTHLRAGSRVAFWNYDAGGRGWYIYGHGSVTPNGKQVVPDPGVRVWEFTGSMITGSPSPPAAGSAPGGPPKGGDPVDLSTGLFDYTRTDLVLPDTIPIVIERSYRQGDSNSYSFGVGTTNRYDLRLWSENNYHEADLILPNGGRVLYKRVSRGGRLQRS